MKLLLIVFAVSATLYTGKASPADLENRNKNVNAFLKSVTDIFFDKPDKEPVKPDNVNVNLNKPEQGQSKPDSKPVKAEHAKPNNNPAKPDEAQGNNRQRRDTYDFPSDKELNSIKDCVTQGVKGIIKCVLNPAFEEYSESSESTECGDGKFIARRYSGEDDSEEGDFEEDDFEEDFEEDDFEEDDFIEDDFEGNYFEEHDFEEDDFGNDSKGIGQCLLKVVTDFMACAAKPFDEELEE